MGSENDSQIFHIMNVLLLNLYTIYFTVYVIEIVWVLKHGMTVNAGAILIISCTIFHLVLKMVAFWLFVYSEVYIRESTNLEDISYQIADFINVLVYFCSFFFIFSLWKSYKCLSDEANFNKYNRHYLITFWITNSIYLFQSIFQVVYIVYLIASKKDKKDFPGL